MQTVYSKQCSPGKVSHPGATPLIHTEGLDLSEAKGTSGLPICRTAAIMRHLRRTLHLLKTQTHTQASCSSRALWGMFASLMRTKEAASQPTTVLSKAAEGSTTEKLMTTFQRQLGLDPKEKNIDSGCRTSGHRWVSVMGCCVMGAHHSLTSLTLLFYLLRKMKITLSTSKIEFK